LKIWFNLIDLTVEDEVACFYMKHDIKTRKTTIFFTKTVDRFAKLLTVCEMSPRLDIRGDPFAFVSAGMSAIIDEWVLARRRSSAKIRKMVSQYC
jgi:hypothetical protein